MNDTLHPAKPIEKQNQLTFAWGECPLHTWGELFTSSTNHRSTSAISRDEPLSLTRRVTCDS